MEQPATRRDEGAIRRGWADTKKAARWWPVQVAATAITAGFATAGALLPEDAHVALRIGTAALGTFGGILIVGLVLLAVLAVCAPVRQRNEARQELARLAESPEDPAAVSQEFSTWLRATRAALPDPPSPIHPFGWGGINEQEMARRSTANELAEQRYETACGEVVRQARIEYHARFRERLVRLLGEESAGDPQTIRDFEAVESLLTAVLLSPDDVAAFKDFAHRFVGWLRGHEIAAPPDLTDQLGADWEGEQARDVVDGVISRQEYERYVQPFTARRKWARELRAEYQRDWRAEVAARIEWVRQAGAMEREDSTALLVVENPHEDDLRELAESVERMAARL